MNQNVRIAKELVRIAKSLTAFDKTQSYLDDIEENALSDLLYKQGWCLYDWAQDIYGDDDNLMGRQCAVWTVDEQADELGEKSNGVKPVSWNELKSVVDGEEDFISGGETVTYQCDEYGPTGHAVSIVVKKQ